MAKNIYLQEGELGGKKLSKASNDLGDAKRILNSSLTYSALRSVRFEDANGADYFFSYDLASDISALSGKVQTLQQKLESYQQIMESAANDFEQIDKEFKEGADWEKFGLKILGKAGFFGGITSAVVSLFTNKDSGASGTVSSLKNLSSIAKTASKWYDSNKKLNKLSRMGKKYADNIRHKRLFGLNDIKSNMANGQWSRAGKWGERFKANFKAYGSPIDDFKAGGSKAVWAGLGIGLDLASNGFGNYDEYKRGEISGGRAFAETVTETVVDTYKDWLIGAAVAATITATVGSAPVLVVGAATVAVSAGLDWVTKKITYAVSGEEKGFTEAVSDLILDGAKAAGKAATQAGRKIAGIVKNALPKIKVPKFNLSSAFA